MKKRLLTVLLAVCLVVALGTVTAWAENGECYGGEDCDHEASIGNIHYDTLQGAINAAEDMDSDGVVTIDMLSDVTLTGTAVLFDTPGSYILDLGNNTLSSGLADIIMVKAGDLELTVRNGKMEGTANNTYGIYVYNDKDNNAGYDDVTVIVDGIEMNCGDQALGVQGLNSNNNLIVKNSTIDCETTAIYFPPMSGELIIENSDITGVGNGIVIKGGSLTVRGDSNIKATGESKIQDAPYGGNTEGIGFPQTGAPIYVEGGYDAKGSSEPRPIEVNIEGGTFESTQGQSLRIDFTESGGSQTVNITGGTFKNDIENSGAGDAKISGATIEGKVQNTYTGTVSVVNSVVNEIGENVLVYNSTVGDKQEFTTEDSIAIVDGVIYSDLASAISAATDGDTITLVQDVNETISIAAGKSIVLDLAGKTLTSPNSMVYGELTIEDSSNSTGTFVSNKSVSVDEGILTLESGTINIENDYGIYCLNDGTAIVNGGKIESLYAPLTGNNTTGKMNFAVNGGELTARSGPAIYMPGQGGLTITGGVLKGGISRRMGQVKITGGTIYATNGDIDSPSEYYNFSGNAWFPDALYVYNGTYNFDDEKYGNSLSLNITGGEFICENGQGSAVAIYDLGKVDQKSKVKISDDATLVTNASDRDAYQVLSLADIVVGTPESGYGHTAGEVGSSISGGTFSTAVDKEYLDSSINYELSSNGKFTYYTTLAEAMAAANEGDTINFVGDESDITVHTVTFVNNGVKTTVEVTDSITLPNPDSRNGYTFGGWRCGNSVYKAGETVKVTSDMTFTAIWSAINIPDTYDIEIADTANGEVDTSLSNASAGSTITITATPDSGYSVASVTVTGPDGRVDVVRVNATTYTFKMPAGDVTVRVTFTDSDALPFTDVSAGQWFYDAVAYVYTNGMMEGDSATTFNPDGTMTRAMFWAVLGRIDGATITGTNWADQARDWAMAEGVSDGTDPNGLVTREQMVTMLWRYAGEPESSASLSAYTDADSVSDWAETAMRWAIDEGIITGMTDTTLVPQGTATRAQCAAIFMRFDQM